MLMNLSKSNRIQAQNQELLLYDRWFLTYLGDIILFFL